MIEEINYEQFKQKIFNFDNEIIWNYNGKPVIVDFYAHWCRPCQNLAPILEQISVEYGDKMHIYKIDIEEEPKLAQLFSIKSIPSILFIPSNQQPQFVNGFINKNQFKELIAKILKIT